MNITKERDERALHRIWMCLEDLHRLEGGIDESPPMKEHRKKDIPSDLAALSHLRSRLAERGEEEK